MEIGPCLVGITLLISSVYMSYMKKDNENVYFGSSLRNNCLLVRMFGSDAKAIKDIAIHLLLEIWPVDTPDVWTV